MSDRYDAGLEPALAELAAAIEFPPTPPLAAAVGVAIREGGMRRRRAWSWAPLQRGLVLGVLAALLAVGAVAALGFAVGGLRITFGEPTPAAIPSGVAADRAFGEEVTLAEAHSAAGFAVRQPILDELGEPDAVFLREPPRGGQVSLVYRDRPGLPAGRDGIGVVVTQFRADIGPDSFEKMIQQGTILEPVEVNGQPGYWIEGGEHFYFYRDATGEVVETSLRLVGNALIWEEDGLTLRIEGARTLDEAQRIAGSLE
jgi:nitrate reductase NapE component